MSFGHEKLKNSNYGSPMFSFEKRGLSARLLTYILLFLFFVICFLACVCLVMLLGWVKACIIALAIAVAFFFSIFKWFGRYFRNNRERALLMEVVGGSKDACMITDGVGNTVFANDNFARLLANVEGEGLEGLSQLFEDDDEAYSIFDNIAEGAMRGLEDSVELQSGDVDGGRWFVVSARPVQGWAGYVHWRIEDITGKMDMERSIRQERKRLVDFTDKAPVGFFSVDGDGRFVFVNSTMARWLGEDIGKLLEGGRLHTYMENPPDEGKPYDIVNGGGKRQIAEIVMKGQGGRTFLASVNQSVMVEDDGAIITRAVVYDLTEEKEMREALKISEDRFQRFFEEAPLGIALVDSENNIRECNRALADMLGEKVRDIKGRNLRDMISEADRGKALFAMSRIQQGEIMKSSMEVLMHGAKSVTVHMHGRKFMETDETVLHLVDITEQKNLEEQFVQSQKMQAIGQLAGGVAHDFNNLLTAIIGFCDLLLVRHKPGDPSFSDIMQIKQNSNRAANLVRQLLALSRQQTLRPEVQDITDIITEVSHLIRRLIGTNIVLDVNHGQNLGLAKVDAGQIEQVLINLAVNARDAMSDGGVLSITTSAFENRVVMERGGEDMPPGRWILIEVSDTGCGIDPENLPRIFEPFFTTKELGEGTGLGLATVHGIIRQTGGYLDVRSCVGEGATFSIYLPMLSEEEAKREIEAQGGGAKSEEEEEAKDLTGTARILLVEDEEAVRSFASRALGNKGYEVIGAESGEDALDKLEELGDDEKIDLLVTDVMMPGMDGPTLAQRLRQTSPDLKIIFISGYTEEKLKDYMGKGIYFLAKPFTLKKLAAKVKEVMEE